MKNFRTMLFSVYGGGRSAVALSFSDCKSATAEPRPLRRRRRRSERTPCAVKNPLGVE